MLLGLAVVAACLSLAFHFDWFRTLKGQLCDEHAPHANSLAERMPLNISGSVFNRNIPDNEKHHSLILVGTNGALVQVKKYEERMTALFVSPKRHVTVLHIPPVVSPITAVKEAIVEEFRNANPSEA